MYRPERSFSMKKIVIFSAMAAIATMASAQEQGRVLSATPIVQQVATPQQVCGNETVYSGNRTTGAGAVMGAIAGGAAGNAIGKGSGRAAATAIGLIGGAVIGNQIEGAYEPGQKVVVIEDLISTGKSSLEVVEVLRKAGVEVIGMVSIFTYGFDVATEAFQKAGVEYRSLTNYPTLINLAIDKQIVEASEQEVLLKWSKDPAHWVVN